MGEEESSRGLGATSSAGPRSSRNAKAGLAVRRMMQHSQEQLAKKGEWKKQALSRDVSEEVEQAGGGRE